MVVPCYGDQLTATTAENVLIGWTLWQLPKVDCSPPGCFISTCIKTCLHLRFYTESFCWPVGKQDQIFKPGQYGSSHSACLPIGTNLHKERSMGGWGGGVWGGGGGQEKKNRGQLKLLDKLYKKNFKSSGTSSDCSPVMTKQFTTWLQTLQKM